MNNPEIKLQAESVPQEYAVCYNHQCPKAGECLRHLCYAALPETEEERTAVLPQAWQGHACTRFDEAKPMQLAWGMSHLFDDVPSWQATAIRNELKQTFGSRSTYFRYRRGEFLITPQQQAQVADIFRRYGFTAPRRYDYTQLAYYFDAPGYGSHHAYDTPHTKERLRELRREARTSTIV